LALGCYAWTKILVFGAPFPSLQRYEARATLFSAMAVVQLNQVHKQCPRLFGK
jgi:hypothetical protein